MTSDYLDEHDSMQQSRIERELLSEMIIVKAQCSESIKKQAWYVWASYQVIVLSMNHEV